MKTYKEFIAEINNIENVQELFITRKSPEERKKEKIEQMKKKLVRLIQYADDPYSDVALRTKKEEYDLLETSLTRVMSKSQEGGMAIMST